MRRLGLTSWAAIAAVGALTLPMPPRTAGSAVSHTGYAIEANVAPARDAAGAFVCTTVVREVPSNRIIANPRLRFFRGAQPGRLRVGGVAPDSVLEITAGVSGDNEARYEARFVESGDTRLVHAVTFALGRDADPAEP
jgi:hypothetical protein